MSEAYPSNTYPDDRLTIEEWLQERHDNARRIAWDRSGADRDGWFEDADYFKEALTALASLREAVSRLEGLLAQSEAAEHSNACVPCGGTGDAPGGCCTLCNGTGRYEG